MSSGSCSRRAERGIGPHVQRSHHAALLEAVRLHHAEQRVQGAHRLLDLGQVDAGAASPGRLQHAVLAQPPEGLADRVAAHPVLGDEFVLAREAFGERPRSEPTGDVVEELGPQRRRLAAIERRRTRVSSSHLSSDQRPALGTTEITLLPTPQVRTDRARWADSAGRSARTSRLPAVGDPR